MNAKSCTLHCWGCWVPNHQESMTLDRGLQGFSRDVQSDHAFVLFAPCDHCARNWCCATMYYIPATVRDLFVLSIRRLTTTWAQFTRVTRSRWANVWREQASGLRMFLFAGGSCVMSCHTCQWSYRCPSLGFLALSIYADHKTDAAACRPPQPDIGLAPAECR